jgi:hypothetical protein
MALGSQFRFGRCWPHFRSVFRRLGAALLSAAALAGCAPKPPPSKPSASPSAAPTVALSPPAPAAASLAPSATPSAAGTPHEPFTVVSKGTSRVPATYEVRNPSGQVMYNVLSSTVVYDRASTGTGEATFTKPHVTFHSQDGRIVVADSPKAVAYDKDKSVVMTGGVRAKTGDGKVLTCATLTYDERNARIQCEGNVVLTDTKTKQSASGQTLVTDPGFEHVMLSGSQ